jgi:hypothetical protein
MTTKNTEAARQAMIEKFQPTLSAKEIGRIFDAGYAAAKEEAWVPVSERLPEDGSYLTTYGADNQLEVAQLRLWTDDDGSRKWATGGDGPAPYTEPQTGGKDD